MIRNWYNRIQHTYQDIKREKCTNTKDGINTSQAENQKDSSYTADNNRAVLKVEANGQTLISP